MRPVLGLGQATAYHSARRAVPTVRVLGSSAMTCSWLRCSRRPATMRLATGRQSTVIRSARRGRRACGTSASGRTGRGRAPRAGGSTARTPTAGPRRAPVGGSRTAGSDRRRERLVGGRADRDVVGVPEDAVGAERDDDRRVLLVQDLTDRRDDLLERHLGHPAVRQTEPLVPVRDAAQRRPRGLVLAPDGRRPGSPGSRGNPHAGPPARPRSRGPGRSGSRAHRRAGPRCPRPRRRRRPGARRRRPGSGCEPLVHGTTAGSP